MNIHQNIVSKSLTCLFMFIPTRHLTSNRKCCFIFTVVITGVLAIHMIGKYDYLSFCYRLLILNNFLKLLPSNQDDFIQPAADVEDAVGILASSLPSKRPAAINHSLMLRKEHPWGCDEDMTKWAET